MRASGTANQAQLQVQLTPQQKFWYGVSDSEGFGSVLSELRTPSAHKSPTTTGSTAAAAIPPAATTAQAATAATAIAPAASTPQAATAATATAPAAWAHSGFYTAHSARNSSAYGSSATEASSFGGEDSITLGPQGSALPADQAAAIHAAQLAAANQAEAATAAARNLTISDYLAPGDSLSNYAAGTTIAQLIQGYSCTVPNMAAPGAGEYATTGRVMVNGAAITGLVPDPYGGPAAPIGSNAAAMFVAEGGSPKGALPPNLQA